MSILDSCQSGNAMTVLKAFRKMTRKHGYVVVGECPGPFLHFKKGTKLRELGGGLLPFEIILTARTTAKDWKRQWGELTSTEKIDAIPSGTRFWRAVKFRAQAEATRRA